MRVNMRAFTQLCEKVNISFYNDTITLYPNKNGMKKNVVLVIIVV